MKNLIILLLVAIFAVISTPCYSQSSSSDIILTKADYPTNFWNVDGRRIRDGMPRFKVLDSTEVGCRVAFYDKEGDLNTDKDIFFIGFHGYSDRDYKTDKMVVKADEPFTYKTALGGSRTIPAYRYATIQEVATVAQRQIDLKEQKFFNLTNRVFYISEIQASNNAAHKVKTPKGYFIYVTNGVSTNLFKP